MYLLVVKTFANGAASNYHTHLDSCPVMERRVYVTAFENQIDLDFYDRYSVIRDNWMDARSTLGSDRDSDFGNAPSADPTDGRGGDAGFDNDSGVY
jgi:hypothetical protein